MLKQLDRAAKIAWCPAPQYSSYIVSAPISGQIDEGSFETKSELEIYDAGLERNSTLNMRRLGSIMAADSFCSVSWGSKGIAEGAFPSGLIAGGMSNGSIKLWNASSIIGTNDDADSLVATVDKHAGQVLGVQFHPKQANLLASASLDGEVFIWDLVDPKKPANSRPAMQARSSPQPGATCLQWNSKVPQILASGNEAGEITVWDLRQRRAIMTLKQSARQHVRATSIQWNPEASVQAVVSYEKTPFAEIWDLRQQLAPFSKLQNGHQGGILSTAWCPHDSVMLLTAGEDSRLLCWNSTTGQPLVTYPSTGLLHQIEWSPNTASVLASCNTEGKVTTQAIHSAGTHVPKWLKRPSGCSFGFGGSLVSFGPEIAPPSPSSAGDKKKQAPTLVANTKISFSNVVTEGQLVELAEQFSAAMQEGDFAKLCDEKIASVREDHEKETWRLMKILLDRNETKKNLVREFGFEYSKTPLTIEPEKAEAKQVSAIPTGPLDLPDEETFLESLAKAEPVLQEPPKEKIDGKSEQGPVSSAEFQEDPDSRAIREAIIVGDFPKAVDKCMDAGHFADALLLASMGGDELFASARNRYFTRHTNPFFAKVVRTVVKSDFATLVDESDLREWKQTLVLLMTYTENDAYRNLVNRLASRLQSSSTPALSQCAIFCYMCASNVDLVVEIWTAEAESHGLSPSLALHSAMEKIVVFAKAVGGRPSPILAAKYSEYAGALASQGNLSTALNYLKLAAVGQEQAAPIAELRQRIEESLKHSYEPQRQPQKPVHHPEPQRQPQAFHQQQPQQQPYLQQQPQQQPYFQQPKPIQQQQPPPMRQIPSQQQQPRPMDPRTFQSGPIPDGPVGSPSSMGASPGRPSVQPRPVMSQSHGPTADMSDEALYAGQSSRPSLPPPGYPHAAVSAFPPPYDPNKPPSRPPSRSLGGLPVGGPSAGTPMAAPPADAFSPQSMGFPPRGGGGNPTPPASVRAPGPDPRQIPRAMEHLPSPVSDPRQIPRAEHFPPSRGPVPGAAPIGAGDQQGYFFENTPSKQDHRGIAPSPVPGPSGSNFQQSQQFSAFRPTTPGSDMKIPQEPPSPVHPPAILTPEQKAVQAVFDNCVSALDAKSADKRKLDDIRKRLAKLYSSYDQVAPAANQILETIAKAIQAKDWKTALNEHNTLVAEHWNGNSNWLPGVKTLLLLANKHVR